MLVNAVLLQWLVSFAGKLMFDLIRLSVLLYLLRVIVLFGHWQAGWSYKLRLDLIRLSFLLCLRSVNAVFGSSPSLLVR